MDKYTSFFLVLLITGCATLDNWHFNRAYNQNTINAYENYLRRCSPDCRHDEEAQWHIAKLKNTIASYSYFLRKYPRSNKKIQAKARISFLEARKSQSIDDIIKFINLYKEYSPDNITYSEYREVLSRLEKLAKRQKSAKGFVILYKETKDKKYLKFGQEYVDSVTNEEDESYFVTEFSEKYFDFKGCTTRPEEAINKSRPVYECIIESKAKFGNYNVRLKLSLQVDIKTKHYRFFTIKKIEEDKEDIEIVKDITVTAGTQRTFVVEFEPIALISDKRVFKVFGEVIERDIVDLPRHEFLDVKLQ